MGGVAASADAFRAIADPTRRAMLDLLHQADRSVTELAGPFRMSQPAISQHLRVLRKAGLVSPRPAGRQRLYHLNPAPLHAVYAWAARYRQVADPFGQVCGLAALPPPIAARATRERARKRRRRNPLKPDD